MRDLPSILHHVAGVGGFIASVSTRCLCVFLAVLLVSEASTPFVNFHWFFRRSSMSGDTLYTANGIAMAVSFFALRILPMPWLYWLIAKYTHSQIVLVHGWPLAIFFLVLFNSASILNLLWFRSIVRGFRQHFQKSNLVTKKEN